MFCEFTKFMDVMPVLSEHARQAQRISNPPGPADPSLDPGS